MDDGTQTKGNKLFMIIALVLTGSLFLGLVGIGGLVVFRLVAGGPTDVAMPLETPLPTKEPVMPATATPSPLPSATAMAAPQPTPTLVVAPSTVGTPAEESSNTTGHDGAGLSSPGPESSEMPQTGLGLAETVGVGLMLVSLLGGTRVARHWRARQ
jgi:hypothetical protein